MCLNSLVSTMNYHFQASGKKGSNGPISKIGGHKASQTWKYFPYLLNFHTSSCSP
jgi:hypothetical protein